MKTSQSALTRREIEIMAQVSCGLFDKEIADKIFISHLTVKQHIKNIYRKMGVRNRVEATLKFLFEIREPALQAIA
ncbi:MAG: helix-turn-helix transcriptional regulator [Ferruginibacter sp.]